MIQPTAISLDGTNYLIAPGSNAFRIVYESGIIARRVEAGGEHGEREIARRDILRWNWTDWSGGEGQEFIDTRTQDTFKRYYVSGGALNIRRRRQVSLGLAAASELDLGALSTLPHLVNAGNPVVVYETSWRKRTSGTWSGAITTGSAANVQGRVAAAGGKVFVGTGTDMRRLNVSAGTNSQWVTTDARPVVVGDSRVYFGDPGTDLFKVRQASLSATGGTDITTLSGHDELVDMALDGNKVYILAAENREKPFLYRGSGTDAASYVEFAKLPDAFYVQDKFREVMTILNGVVFIGGYFKDPFGGVDDPALIWVTEESSGVVGRIRERGNGEQIKSVYATIDNEVLMGTDKGNLYAYNMNTGGFYQFVSGISSSDDVVSMCYDDGQFFFATTNGGGNEKIYATKTSGSGKYPSSVKVEGSKWDFDADARKILLDVSVSGTFPTDTSASFSFSFDGGAEVTTDASGATMTANTTGTTTFTISSASVERTGFMLKPFLTLTATDTSATPTIHGVVINATTFDKTKFIECTLDLTGDARTPGRFVTGPKAAAEIEALIESTASRIVSVKPFWEKPAQPFPRASDTYSCVIDEASLETTAHGRSIAALRMRVLDA